MNNRTFHCAMDITTDYISGKWKTLILRYLEKGKKRFGELNKLIMRITEKMLSIQLRQLEESGLVRRTVYPKVPVKVEYSLTPMGTSLVPVLDAIARWGRALGDSTGKLVHMKQQSASTWAKYAEL
jgi:DNA-binding HxlR family transcriptional regulator